MARSRASAAPRRAASTSRQGTTDVGTVGRHIGATVRRLRASMGLTLGEVTKRSGISRAMLSRLETGDVMPSLETLVALTDALGVGISSLFHEIGRPTASAQHVHRGEGLEVVRRGTKRGHTYHLLAADRGPRRAFEPFLVTLTDKSEVFPGFEHPGVEFIYLLEGSLTYRHGDGSHLLKPGDSLTFAGSTPHGPEKLIRLPIRMLSIIIYTGAPED
ncbi:MAG TPA: XRE family transcriptional regulator [Steroidobacteraceae bacterium]|nr:XRE family transcriptional regulator [Steroidobacteraceae bacterium]